MAIELPMTPSNPSPFFNTSKNKANKLNVYELTLNK